MSDERPSPLLLPAEGLAALIDGLTADGYRVFGPAVRGDAIDFVELECVGDLAQSWTDTQAPGRYRLRKTEARGYFEHAVGPQSLKRFFHPPSRRLWRAQRNGTEVEIEAEPADAARYAFLGVRACDLAALAVLDRVLGADRHYRAVRETSLLIAVNCSRAADTCFCTSMDSGPAARSGFDLALTELVDGARHIFVVDVGSEKGGALIGPLGLEPAGADDVAEAQAVVARTAKSITRRLDADAARAALQERPDHPRWDEVAERCLSCANCTMVCPTCFCSDVEDVSDLSGAAFERRQHWLSCFTLEFSYLGDGPVRASAKSRYRQWLTHKLSTWHDQFGTSGCVGCGRCVTWCPVGIDILEEANAISGASP